MRAKGYTFSVLSNDEKFSQLRFVCADDASIKNLISNISVLSRAQSNIPIILAFSFVVLLLILRLEKYLFHNILKYNMINIS